MTTFAYTARDATGHSASGTLSAASIGEALQLLRSEGKFPVSVKPAEQATAAPDEVLPQRDIRISRADVIHFATQLAIMIETGVVLSEALECIGKQAEKPNVKAMITDISDQVQQGVCLSDALGRHPRSFPQLFVALIRASEKSGMLARLLNRATTYLRDEQEMLRKVKGALMYPLIMLSFAVSTTVFLLIFVLPRFTVIYATKQAALPVPTRLLMGASNALIHHWYLILLGLGGTAAALSFYFRTPAGARVWHWIQLSAPLFGKLYKKVHLARGLRMIGTLAGAGVSLMDCVTTAGELCPNTHFRDLWKRVGDHIQAGRQLSDPLFESPLVPRSVAQMVFSGEKSGKLAHVMEQIAGYAEVELKEQIASLTRYIEPLMIVIMGIIIGGVCLALLLPIFTISKVMAQ